MTKREARKLPHGVYRLFWKSSESSVASIGSLYDGARWFAPANWTGNGKMEVSTEWRLIESVVRIIHQD